MEAGVAARADGVDLLVERDEVVVGDAGPAELEDAELGEALAALVDDEVPGEGVHVLEPHDRVVGDQRRPVLRRRGRDGCGAELEVGPGAVVEDQEDVPAGDDGVVEVVLQPLAPRGEDPPAGLGGVGVEEAVLGRGLGAGGDDQEPVAAGPAHAHVEPAVLLGVDQLVVGLRGAQRVPPDLVGTPGVVDGRVVEVGALAVPGGTPEDADDLVTQQLTGLQVLDPDRVALVAPDVGGVGQQPLVGAHRGPAQGEEVVALGELVEVEEQLLAGEGRLVGRAVLGRGGRGPVALVGDRDAAAGAVLLALEGTRVVPVPADPGGDRQVGLQRARLDLLEDRLPQVGEVRGALLGVGVLGLEVLLDLGGVLVTQPLVVVGAGQAVDLGGGGALVGDRRLHGRDDSVGP